MAVEVWNRRDNIEIPRLINKTAVRKIMNTQVSDQTIDFIELVMVCLLRTIVKGADDRGIKRIGVSHVQEILSDDKEMHFDVGAVVYNHIDVGELENKITNNILSRIIGNAFKRKEIDLRAVDFSDMDGDVDETEQQIPEEGQQCEGPSTGDGELSELY